MTGISTKTGSRCSDAIRLIKPRTPSPRQSSLMGSSAWAAAYDGALAPADLPHRHVTLSLLGCTPPLPAVSCGLLGGRRGASVLVPGAQQNRISTPWLRHDQLRHTQRPRGHRETVYLHQGQIREEGRLSPEPGETRAGLLRITLQLDGDGGVLRFVSLVWHHPLTDHCFLLCAPLAPDLAHSTHLHILNSAPFFALYLLPKLHWDLPWK